MYSTNQFDIFAVHDKYYNITNFLLKIHPSEVDYLLQIYTTLSFEWKH